MTNDRHNGSRTIPEKGLVIGKVWAERIVSAEKTWELRKRPTAIRGPIGIIAKGTGSVIGTADVADCLGPLSLEQLRDNRALACETEEEILKDIEEGYVYAWVLKEAIKFGSPVPYKHPSGAVTWVDLTKALSGEALASPVSISSRSVLAGDFERIGRSLSGQTLSKGAPPYNPLSVCFQAAAEGKILGEAIATINWGKMEIDLMFVEPDHRGQGIGTALMNRIDEFARAGGLKAIRLNTPTWQGAGFYERAGFTEMGRIPLADDDAGNPQAEVTYVKILTL